MGQARVDDSTAQRRSLKPTDPVAYLTSDRGPLLQEERITLDMATDAGLTPKQREVVKLISSGKTVPEAAKSMKINPQGVYGHIRRIKDAGLGNLLETGVVASLEANASSNGSSEVEDRIGGLVEEAVLLADARITEIEERRGAIKDQTNKLTVEDDTLAVEAARLTDEREALAQIKS